MWKIKAHSVPCSIVALVVTTGLSTASDIDTRPSASCIAGSGRNSLRTADGGILSAYSQSDGNRLVLSFSTTRDNGNTWTTTKFPNISGDVVQAAIDSNFKGSYIAFTETVNGSSVGRIAYSTNPISLHPRFVVSPAATPPGIDAHDTFIQASRKGWGSECDKNRETVAYGWQDNRTKSLYIGVSRDGETFPVARKVIVDPYATSGPAVAIRGDFVIATYQTKNPDFAPTDIPTEQTSNHSYPVWIESWDAGQTWSYPKPLFGLTSSDFPRIKIETVPDYYESIALSGGTDQSNSPILNWGSTFARSGGGGSGSGSNKGSGGGNASSRELIEKDEINDKAAPQKEGEGSANNANDGITFVQTSMSTSRMRHGEGEVSIVSFRKIEPGATWTHVIANNNL